MQYNALGIQLYSQMMIRVSNHLLSIVFRFQYHSQEVIGSLGNGMSRTFFFRDSILAGCTRGSARPERVISR